MQGTIEAILSRRSIRSYTSEPVARSDITMILEAARWAPSGLNNQPWKFIVVQKGDTISKLASCTRYSAIVKGASVIIAVFLDTSTMYDRTKDAQAIGAAIQNMLLACCELGLGAVWLGEILNNKEQVNLILEAPESLELMAALAIGYPDRNKTTSSRKELKEIAFEELYGDQWR
ncbi:nitroreductase family protein [Methanomethylovorans sp.]|uniref:nitroreductase family protein n=1 Tax=Methanomethylovorans sp. TaxID=2758717 RepID=UPI00351C4F6D